MKKFMSFLKDEDGQGMVEYAIIIGLIAVAATSSEKHLTVLTKLMQTN